jgi:glycosyltransferase involved in cell wall biosynthesis
MRLIYTANARIPSEKAHPYQIVQMCEAFAVSGAEVTLLYPSRSNPPELQTTDIWNFYGVERIFQAERLPVLDVYSMAHHLPHSLVGLWENFAALLVLLSFCSALITRLLREPDAIIYSRDPLPLALIAWLWPRRAKRLFFEAHTYPSTRLGLRVRRWLAERIGGFIVITDHLRQRYQQLGVLSERLLVAHDGIRRQRFQIEGDRTHWRARIGWPEETFIVGYMGRFHTLGMDKGLNDLVSAAMALFRERSARPIYLALVGGPPEYVEALRKHVRTSGISVDMILYAGQVHAAYVPGYLRAFDVCTMPFPWTEHFAYYASPMKLFEYMASGSPIIATHLPSTAEILCDGRNALLVPPGDPEALSGALRRLRDDLELSNRLSVQASQDVLAYTWEARAANLLHFVEMHLA